MELIAIFREFAQGAAPVAVAALWKGVVLAAGLAACLRFARRLSAADRFLVWSAGFLAAAVLPFLPWFGSLGTSTVAASGMAAGTTAWLDFDPRWTLVIAGVWIAASVWRIVDLAAHGLRLRRLWKRAQPVGSERAVVGVGVEVCTTRDVDRPSVIGFFRPRILIPGWLLEQLTERELEQVVLHEAEHLRRRDDWINLVQKLALAVFPLNPALWWIERRMCREREMACDEAVVRATEKPRDYAACLASLAERGLERRLERRREALSLGAWHRRPELVERVHRILRRGPGLSPASARGLLAVVGCGLVLGSVEFARCPQLVAFTAPPAATAQDVADSATTTASGNGYKMVNALARVPSRAEMAEMRAGSRPGEMHAVLVLATGKSRKDGTRTPVAQEGARKMLMARRDAVQARLNEMNTAMVAKSEAAQAGQVPVEQLVVFTTWEQVETAGNARQASEAQAQDKQTAAPQVAVTQLIFRVYPNPTPRTVPNGPAAAPESGTGKTSSKGTSSISGSKSNSGSKPISNSVSGPAPLRQMIPLRDGWLVLQL